MYRHQNRPTVITWKQFANKGYSAFASLHRQVRIGVLSVATLGVAAAAQAQRQSSPIVTVEEEKIIDEEELAEVTVSGTMAPLTQLQSARIVSVLSRQDIEQAAVQSINDLFKLVTGVDVRQRGGFGIQTDISIDGGTLNSSWRKGQLFYQGDYENDALKLDWQFGFSKKSYGANTFYSANYPDQYERNQRLMTSISAETKGRFHFTPQVFWNRSWDNFELVHNSTFGENFHRTDVFGLKAGGHIDWQLGKTAVSALLRHENILSTNLGCNRQPEGDFYAWNDNRTTVSFSLEHNILLRHWTISAGLMASMTSAIDHRFRFYPGVDVAYRPTSSWKLLFSYNKGFRLPTFTELYYKSPTHEGNRDLKAEHNHSFSLGAEHRWSGAVASVRGFYHRGTQMIDWVMYAPDDIFHTASFDLDNVGVQVQGKLSFPDLFGHDTWVRSLSMGYTYIHQTKHDAEGVVKSNMAMEYLRHKAVASFTHRIARVKSSNHKWLNGICELTWDFRWQERVGSYMSGGELVPYHPYAMLDAKLQWKAPRYQVFVQATNITNHCYYDLGSVPQPGIWVMAGAKVKLNLNKKH